MADGPPLSVVVPCHNPNPARLRRVLAGLRAQTLAPPAFEVVLVDNASSPALPPDLGADQLAGLSRRVVTEPRPGLTPARLAGIAAARGDVIVFVDDDNVLDPRYLESARDAFAADTALAAAGGPVVPEYGTEPPAWSREFAPLLALRDLGPAPLHARGGAQAPWPEFAPVGAGLCVRRPAAEDYARAVATDPRRTALDRRAGQLTSGGDNDLVFTALRAGGGVAYLPALRLTHLIPESRLQPAYLARLNRAIQRSWVRVLALHGERPWPSIPRWTLPLRLARARLRTRPWRGPAENIRYHGIAGRLEGQADLASA
jgi:glycosyltransferase involved in cell wall biosynthesis